MLIKLGFGFQKEIDGGLRWGFATHENFIMNDCPTCREQFQNKPRNIVCGNITAQSHDNKDWRRLLIEYLTYGYLKGPHISKNQYKKVTRQSREYFIEEGKLKRILSNGDVKICIAGREINEYLQGLHVTESGEHLSEELMWHLIVFGPYWWPTCGADIHNLCTQKCADCHSHGKFSKDSQVPSRQVGEDPPRRATTDWRQPYME